MCKEYELDGFVRICDTGDYESAYADYVELEMGFGDEFRNIVSYDEFVEQLQKGYGNSDITQIARLLENEDGIYYDNEYVAWKGVCDCGTNETRFSR